MLFDIISYIQTRDYKYFKVFQRALYVDILLVFYTE